jgi:hypothetical protein
MRALQFGLAALILFVLAHPSQAKIVHRWSFAENPNDSIGTAHAMLREGATIADGKLNMDGQGGYAEVPIGDTLSKLSQVTIEGWVTWPEQQAAWVRFFDFGTGQMANMFLTPRNGRVTAGGTVGMPRFAVTTGGFNQEQQLNAPEAFPTGAETHFALTMDGDARVGKLYVNGKLVATNNEMALKPSNLGATNNNYLGASQYFEADPALRGTISEFRIYDTALTEAEIADSAKRGPDQMDTRATPPRETMAAARPTSTTPSGGLVHRWSFASDASDSVGKANGTLESGATIADGRLVLDGQQAHAVLPIGATIEKLTNASVETWVKWDERQRPWLRLFDFGARAGKSMYVTPRNGGGRRGSPRNTLRFTITTGGDAGEQQANSPDEFPVGEDTHVVMTLDADKDVAKLYVNGKLAATQEEVTLSPSDLGNTSNNFIGRSQFPSDPHFKGSFAEFRIYNKTLSPEEVEANFKAGPEKPPGTSASADTK